MIKFPHSWTSLKWKHWRSELMELLQELYDRRDFNEMPLRASDLREIEELFIDNIPNSEREHDLVGGVFINQTEAALFNAVRSKLIKSKHDEIKGDLVELYETMLKQGRAIIY